jgi:flagellar basal body-associated protein FliL
MDTRTGLDKRKIWLFLALVAAAILCVIVLIYLLMYAKPRANPIIKNGGHTLLRQTEPGEHCPFPNSTDA